MIQVNVKPRADGRYDFHVGDEGDDFANSSQGYENPADAIEIVRRIWAPLPTLGDVHTITWGTDVRVPAELVAAVTEALTQACEPVVMRVTYRDGQSHTERLR